MLNDNMQSLAFSPIPEQNPIEAYGNMLHSDGFISVSRHKSPKNLPVLSKRSGGFPIRTQTASLRPAAPKKRFPAPGAEPDDKRPEATVRLLKPGF